MSALALALLLFFLMPVGAGATGAAPAFDAHGSVEQVYATGVAPEPVLSLRETDVEPMPANEFVKVTIPLYYEGHAYRAGSRIRVTIAAPGVDVSSSLPPCPGLRGEPCRDYVPLTNRTAAP